MGTWRGGAAPGGERLGGNGQLSHKNSFLSVRFQSGTKSAHVAFSIYLCIDVTKVLSTLAAAAAAAEATPASKLRGAYLLRD